MVEKVSFYKPRLDFNDRALLAVVSFFGCIISSLIFLSGITFGKLNFLSFAMGFALLGIGSSLILLVSWFLFNKENE
ncbi:MAG: hypothetical protein HY394_01330 [Candidatus Diapherotrites archaeon]|nr:hypothetical protein [Candidatus Diapherotrites archaeon]